VCQDYDSQKQRDYRGALLHDFTFRLYDFGMAILHFAEAQTVKEMQPLERKLLINVKHSGRVRSSSVLPDSMHKMETQQTADPPVKVHFTALNAPSEERAFVYVQYLSGHPKTVGVDKSSDVDTVTNLQFSHCSPSRSNF
jgi:hypothetical protein